MKKEYWIFLILPLGQAMVIIGNYIGLRHFSLLTYIGIILGIAADGVLFYILVRGSQKERLEQEAEAVRHQRETERMRVELLEERRRKLLSMQKELEARFQYLNEEIERGNMESARQELQSLQEKLKAAKPNSYCQNMIVNAVLDEKEKRCKEHGAIMEVNAFIPRKPGVEPLHLCSIFANLLDNAIEAVKEIEASRRLIEINAEMKGNYLFIKVKNETTYEHAKRKKREGRGNGTLILKDIVQKYDGSYKAGYKEGIYTSVLMLRVMGTDRFSM
ncbi:hypothetical protein IMSAGC007_02682 [Lachnospiraceae bacterium]|nr:hypothetical protein IMSAGC007_02682 [Lachnospiraceae bacterium]